MPKWTFKWITDWDEIWSADFLGQWNAWIDQSWSNHVFYHPSLARAWVETYLPIQDIKPLFLVARQKSITVFFPLVLWQRNWKNAFLRKVIPLGYSDFDYHDPIITGQPEDFDCEAFWTALVAALEDLELSFDRLKFNGITEKFAGSGDNWRQDGTCPYSDISSFEKPEEFLPTLGKHLLGELKRRIRHLEEQSPLTFHVYSKDDINEALAALPQFLSVHAQRWPNAYKAPRFHENLLQIGLPAGVVHFSELRLADKPISWRLCFVDRKRFYSYMPAFDSRLSKFSPGQVHLLKCIEDAIRLRLDTYDNLRGEESYKSDWTNHLVRLHNSTVQSDRFLSRIKCFMVDKIKPKLLEAKQWPGRLKF